MVIQSLAKLPSFIFLLALALSEASGGTFRHSFKSTSNFGERSRWKDSYIPCSGDTVQFEPDKVVSVFVQSNFTVTEIVLPMDGDFIIGDGVMWGASPDLSPCSQGSGKGKQATFLSDADSWLDGDNWQAYDVIDGSALSPLDLLDEEKVPCQYAQAEFASQNSWTADVPIDVTISSISVWGQAYTSQSFSTYRASGSGRYQFQGTGYVSSSATGCSDPTGCVCREPQNAEGALSRICQESSCPPSTCSGALQVAGMCCDTCGASITMSYGSGYSEQAMQQQIDALKADTKYKGLHTVLSKIAGTPPAQLAIDDDGKAPYDVSSTADYIQVLMVDEATGTSHGDVAKDFSDALYDVLSSPNNNLGVTNVRILKSGPGTSPRTGPDGGAIAGIVIGSLCLLALIVAAVVFLHNRRFGAFAPHSKLKEEELKNFSNPLYDLSPMDTIPPKSLDFQKEDLTSSTSASITGIPQALTSDFGVSFGNPLYQEEDV